MAEQQLILAVETSGRIGSVALANGEKILECKAFSGFARHSAEIIPTIQDLLQHHHKKAHQIREVYVSIGPGSFTGLRIAVSLAKAMHLATGARIVAVDTLDVIAANALDYVRETKRQIQNTAIILDAKRGQFFVAAYKLRIKPDGVIEPDKTLADCLMTTKEFQERFADKDEKIYLLGEGLLYYKDAFKAPGINFLPEKYWNPSAEKVYQLGRKLAAKGKFAEPIGLEPNYLLRPEAEEKRQRCR